jgi:hypothetical protein
MPQDVEWTLLCSAIPFYLNKTTVGKVKVRFMYLDEFPNILRALAFEGSPAPFDLDLSALEMTIHSGKYQTRRKCRGCRV